MSKLEEYFFAHQAQTTPHPLGKTIVSAEGSYIIDAEGQKYLDFVAGVSACSLGHRPKKVMKAVQQQLESYWHVMVYGEFIQEPVVQLTRLLATHLPSKLETTYLTNSGTEAIEGAMKLAKRVTGRPKIVAAKNAYHGNTQGSMSVLGVENRISGYRPLLPGISFIEFNKSSDLNQIDGQTAAVILETIQGGAGFIVPQLDYLQKVSTRCKEVGALLILDEIQPGIGRTGKMFAFEHFGIEPDIVVMGKGLGGGFPIGAFSASATHMKLLQHHPKLGHITTFGGHPVIAAAAKATLETIVEENLMLKALEKEAIIRRLLTHPLIREIRGKGLMLALMLPDAEIANKLVHKCMDKGLILFWLLFETKAVRITPPLTISIEEIEKGCRIILETLNEIDNEKNVD